MKWRFPRPSKGLRVLMLTYDVMVDRRILLEARTLIRAGYEVYLLAGAGPDTTEFFETDAGLRIERIQYEPGFRSRYLTDLPTSQKHSDGFRSRLRSLGRGPQRSSVNHAQGEMLSDFEEYVVARAVFYNPDIVHAHDLPTLPIGARVKQSLRIPLVYDAHEFYPEQSCLSADDQEWLRRRERLYIGDTDVRFTVNPCLAEIMRETYGLDEFQVIQNATTDPSFDQQKSYNRLREDCPRLADRRILLFQGWMSSERNLAAVVLGMAQIQASDWTLVLMGYGDYRTHLEDLVREHALEDRVVFLPAVPQSILLQYSASADVGLIPYPTGLDPNTQYASPNKLYEFIAAGLPILANDLDFVKTVVEGEGFGWVRNLDSPESFARALDEVSRCDFSKVKGNLQVNRHKYLWEEQEAVLLKLYDRCETVLHMHRATP